MYDPLKKHLALGALALAAGWAAHASAATGVKLTADETKQFSTCMAMKSEDMAVDGDCKVVIKKTNVTEADMIRMKACEAATSDVDHDPNCMAMMKKHPELVRGHGRDDDMKPQQ